MSVAERPLFDDALTKRVVNVLEWGVTTGPSHPAASFEKFAEQILKVIEHEGWLRKVRRKP